jgi:hypothetical protein
MKHKYRIWGIIFLGLVGVFLLRQYFLLSDSTFQLVGEKGVIILRTTSKSIISLGNTQSSNAQMMTGVWGPFQTSDSHISLEEMIVGSEHRSSDFVLQKITPHIARGIFGTQTMWFFDTNTESEFSELKSHPVHFQSDIWVLQGNQFPNFFPPPQVALLYVGERTPSDRLKTFAREHSIPLISSVGTGGFLMKYQEKVWQIWTRK